MALLPTSTADKAASGDIFAYGGNKVNLTPSGGIDTNNPTTPVTPTTSTPDYTLHTGESIPAYDARVAQYYTKPTSTAPTGTTPPTSSTIPPPTNAELTDAQKAFNDQQAQTDAQNQTYIDQINGYANGTIPLSAAEQAQIDGLKASFQALIDQQKVTNAGAEGLGNVRGYQTGAAEYDPNFQARTIGAIVTAGQNKIADLNTKMASAVAALTDSFRTKDMNAAKMAYDAYNSAAKERAAFLQKNLDDVNAKIKQSIDLAQKAKDDYFTQVEKPIQDIVKTATENGASPEVAAMIGKAKTPEEAMAIAAQGNVANSTVMDLIKKYPDAGIIPGDSIAEANAKIQKSPSFTNTQKAAALDIAYKQSEIAKNYAGISGDGTDSGKAIGTTGKPTIDVTQPGYSTDIVPGTGGLTQAAIDQDALATALGQPLPVPLGLSSTGAGGQKRTAINNRMAELNAGGNVAANKATLTANVSALKTQTEYLNATQRAFNTANDTLDALSKWMTKNRVNPSQFPDINKFYNYLKSKGIDPGQAGGYNAQIATLRAEYSQVLAKGGVRSVETDQQAAKLIPDGLSPAQLAQVAERIKVDGQNVVNDATRQVQSIQNKINGIISGQTSGYNLNAYENGGTGNSGTMSNGVDLSKFNQ